MMSFVVRGGEYTVVGEIEIGQEARTQPYQRKNGSNWARDRIPFGLLLLLLGCTRHKLQPANGKMSKPLHCN